MVRIYGELDIHLSPGYGDVPQPSRRQHLCLLLEYLTWLGDGIGRIEPTVVPNDVYNSGNVSPGRDAHITPTLVQTEPELRGQACMTTHTSVNLGIFGCCTLEHHIH